MLCALSLSKARTKFQSDFHRRTNRFKRRKRKRINVIKTKWMQRWGNEKKKWSQGKRTITVAIDTPSPPPPLLFFRTKKEMKKFDESLLQYFCLVYWLKNVSKSNYSALMLTANDEVHTHALRTRTTSHNNNLSANAKKEIIIVEQKPSKNNLLFQKQLQKTFTVPSDKPNCTATAAAVVVAKQTCHFSLC